MTEPTFPTVGVRNSILAGGDILLPKVFPKNKISMSFKVLFNLVFPAAGDIRAHLAIANGQLKLISVLGLNVFSGNINS